MRRHVCRHVYTHVYRHVYTHVHRHVYTHVTSAWQISGEDGSLQHWQHFFPHTRRDFVDVSVARRQKRSLACRFFYKRSLACRFFKNVIGMLFSDSLAQENMPFHMPRCLGAPLVCVHMSMQMSMTQPTAATLLSLTKRMSARLESTVSSKLCSMWPE